MQRENSLFFVILVFKSSCNFMISWLKHQIFFITSGLDNFSAQLQLSLESWMKEVVDLEIPF